MRITLVNYAPHTHEAEAPKMTVHHRCGVPEVRDAPPGARSTLAVNSGHNGANREKIRAGQAIRRGREIFPKTWSHAQDFTFTISVRARREAI
jgi:hypothetical protein